MALPQVSSVALLAARVAILTGPALLAARVAILTGPALLAFFRGGYFTGARLVALIVAWAVLAVVVLAAPPRLPRGPAALTFAGLIALTGWTALSATWSPLSGPAADSLERALLYLGAVGAAYAAFRPREAARWVEPAALAGIVVVVGGGLLARLLPGIVDLDPSIAAGGRLDQPLTYWNGMGAIAAMGLVLAARVGGDRTRAIALRAAAGAAAAPLGLGVYLTFSRGALAALAVGIAVLLALTPTRTQLRAIALALEAAAAAAIAGALLPAVADGTVAKHSGEGVAMVAIAATLAALAAAVQAAIARAEAAGDAAEAAPVEASSAEAPRFGAAPVEASPAEAPPLGAAPVEVSPAGAPPLGAAPPETAPAAEAPPRAALRSGPLPAARRVRAAAWLAAGAFAVAPFAAAVLERAQPSAPAFGETTERLTSAGSYRYGYWRAAVEAFADDPAIGGGAGSFPVAWLEKRPSDVETIRDAHSLELETAAELGLVGVLALLLLLAGAAAATARVARTDPALAAGPAAALATWLAHASIDWDWELPALTLVACVLTGMLLARATADSEHAPG